MLFDLGADFLSLEPNARQYLFLITSEDNESDRDAFQEENTFNGVLKDWSDEKPKIPST